MRAALRALVAVGAAALVAFSVAGCGGAGISEEEVDARTDAAYDRGYETAKREAATTTRRRINEAWDRGYDSGFELGGDRVTSSFNRWQEGEDYIVEVKSGPRGIDWQIHRRIRVIPSAFYSCPAGESYCNEDFSEASTAPTIPDDEPGIGIGCDRAYPDVCIPSPPPYLNCGDVVDRDFSVPRLRDPHGFDGDYDGIGCES